MGFLFGIPRKLLKRITEIEIDTHYYDNDVVPSSQNLFTYTIDTIDRIATITGFVSNNITNTVIPYRIKFGDDTSNMYANVNIIKNGSFKDNKYLIDMTIPNTIDEIPSNCFKGCTSLSRINIPKSIRSIKNGAFSGCTNLNSIFIPFTVTTIEQTAFEGCTNLKIICYKNSVAEAYAQANDIKYSLISYTLDEDITENSPNLVTSGIIFKHVRSILEKLSAHINNKSNPHDNSNFNNSNLTGTTTIRQGNLTNVIDNNNSLINKEYVTQQLNELKVYNARLYQTIIDTDLNTDNNNIVEAINELNNKIATINSTIDNIETSIVNINQRLDWWHSQFPSE